MWPLTRTSWWPWRSAILLLMALLMNDASGSPTSCARPSPRKPRRAGNAAGSTANGEYSPLIVSVNTTGWKALQQYLVEAPDGLTAVMAQETWIPPDRLDEASAWCERRGWKAALSPAQRTAAGGWSAGVGIFTRGFVGLRWLGGATSYAVSPHRAVAGVVEML